MGDHIGDDWRAGASLRQCILVTRNLRDHRCNVFVQFEVSIPEKETTHPAEVDRWKEILQVEIEDPAAVAVLSGICDDRPLALEAVSCPVLALLSCVDFVHAVLQEIGQLALQDLQSINRSIDRSLPAVPFGNL